MGGGGTIKFEKDIRFESRKGLMEVDNVYAFPFIFLINNYGTMSGDGLTFKLGLIFV